MPDVKEVFEIVTQKSRPDPGPLERQHVRQESRERRRRVTALAVTTLLVAALAGGFVLVHHAAQVRPAHTSAPSESAIPPVVKERVLLVGLDGTTRSVPFLPANAQSPTLSPDGSLIAFVAKDHGTQQLGLVGSDGKDLRFVTDLPFAPAMPAWSPDSARLAFVAGLTKGERLGARQEQTQNVFVLNADGSHLRRLTSNPHNLDQWPTWSPDGSTIAYSVSGHAPGSDFFATQEIWTIPLDGGTPTRLTHNGVFDDMPSYSHDGGIIAYSHGGRIWLMDADGGHQRELAGQPAGDGNFNPRWGPVGYEMMILTFERFGAVTRDAGGTIVTVPLLTVRVYNAIGATLTTLPVKVASDINAPAWTIDRAEVPNPPAWLPTDAALLVNSYPG